MQCGASFRKGIHGLDNVIDVIDDNRFREWLDEITWLKKVIVSIHLKKYIFQIPWNSRSHGIFGSDFALLSGHHPSYCTIRFHTHVKVCMRRPVQNRTRLPSCLPIPTFSFCLFLSITSFKWFAHMFSFLPLTLSSGVSKYEYLFPLVFYHCWVGFHSLQTILLGAVDLIRPTSFIFFVVQVQPSLGGFLVLQNLDVILRFSSQ